MCRPIITKTNSKDEGFTLVELLIVISLMVTLAVIFYGDIREQARILELTAYSEEAQNIVNALDFNREYSLTDEFTKNDVEIFCKKADVSCSYLEGVTGSSVSQLILTLNTPEGQWRFLGAKSSTIGSGDNLQSVLTFYPRKKYAISSQYSLFPSMAAKQQF